MDIKKVPNILTVIRMALVPVFMALIVFPILPSDAWVRGVGAVLFALISLTDMLDGQIARKYHCVSDFGKFLDPIADKLLVMGGMMSLIFYYLKQDTLNVVEAALGLKQDLHYDSFALVMTFSLFIVIARELAVTSLRLICKNSEGAVIAANMAGKIKTVSQIIFIVAAFIEPLLFSNSLWISYISLTLMTVMTVYSGINYFMIYLPLLKKKPEEKTEA